MFQTAVLASGSKGNSILVRTQTTAILVDAGLSYKRTREALSQHDISPESLTAIVVSHEHSDHVRGIGPVCRKLNIPVYVTKPTYVNSSIKREKIPSEIIHFQPGDYISIGDLIVHPFPSSHDAIDACNFTVVKNTNSSEQNQATSKDERKLAIAIDLGFCSKLLINKIKDATSIILESNHDTEMLMTGGYPWELKQRIKSINGHLSNEQAIGVISQILHPDLENIILAHLSEENNNPRIVRELFNDYLFSVRCDTHLTISSQHSTTPLIDV